MNTKLLQATAVSVFGVACLFTLFWILPSGHPKLLGNSKTGFEAVRDAAITPRDAIDLARPHLDLSYTLRRGMRQPSSSPSDRDPLDWVSFQNGIYYIARDDYPSYSPGFYTHFAVTVDSASGVVTAPGGPSDGG